MSKSLWEFYIDTVVDVWLEDGQILTIEQVSEECGDQWPFGDQEVAWILTACNPRSEPLSDEVNAERHQQLGEQLAMRGYPFLETVGFDPNSDMPNSDTPWSEPGYAVVGMSEDEVIALAREWEQNAIYGWFPDRWELIGVLMPGRDRHGWKLKNRGLKILE